MTRRRPFLGMIVAGAVAATGGCGLLGDEIEASANPARVGRQALTDTGFEHGQTESQTFEDEIQVGDTQRNISITNWVSEYTKLAAGDETQAASFLLFTSPTVTVAGQSVNPFDRLDEKALIRALIERSGRGQAENLEEVGTRTVQVLGSAVELTTYRTTQQVAGQDIDVLLHFGSLTNDGNLVALLDAHPEVLDESENIDRLAAGIEHPTEP